MRIKDNSISWQFSSQIATLGYPVTWANPPAKQSHPLQFFLFFSVPFLQFLTFFNITHRLLILKVMFWAGRNWIVRVEVERIEVLSFIRLVSLRTLHMGKPSLVTIETQADVSTTCIRVHTPYISDSNRIELISTERIPCWINQHDYSHSLLHVRQSYWK